MLSLHIVFRPNSSLQTISTIKLIARKSVDIKIKIKVHQLIEKLSGPAIGYYCYEFFPLTTYQIYLYFCQLCNDFHTFYGFHLN